MKQKFDLYFTNLYPNVKKANKKIKISGINPESQLSFFVGKGEL